MLDCKKDHVLMNKRLIDYQEQLLQDLRDPQEATAYLDAARQDEDPRVFVLALKNVVDVQKNDAKQDIPL